MTTEEYNRLYSLMMEWKQTAEAERQQGLDNEAPPANRGYAFGRSDGFDEARKALLKTLLEMQGKEPPKVRTQEIAPHR